MRLLLAIFGVLVSLSLTACSIEPPLPPGTGASTVERTVYRLGSGDKFKLDVFNEPSLSGGEYAVTGQGEVSLPLIGIVRVGGMSLREAESAITARYADGYLSDPKVNLNVILFRPFYILGEVKNPGEYAFSDGLTVLNAVAKSGGFTYRAARRDVYIRHADASKEELVRIAPDTPVMPGDTIRVVERFF